MKLNADFTKILGQELEQKWVALSMDRTKVIDSSSDLAILEKRVGSREVIYMKVLSSDREFAF